MKMKCKKNEKKKSCVKASVYRLEPNMLNSVTLVASLNGRVSFEESESSSTWHDDTSRLLRCKNWMPHVPFQQPSKRTTTYLKWRRASVTHVHKHGACVKAESTGMFNNRMPFNINRRYRSHMYIDVQVQCLRRACRMTLFLFPTIFRNAF